MLNAKTAKYFYLAVVHTDGNIELYAEEIARTPLNGLQAIDPLAGMDIIALKQGAGRGLCLCGNLDCALILTGNPDQIYENTMALLTQMASYSGFSLGASNVVEKEAGKESFYAMVQAYQDFIRK